MKKNILGLLLFGCWALCLASCSDDEGGTSGGDDVAAGNMRVSAIFPESLTDGQGMEMSGHQLRFIIELWTKGDAAQPAYRTEQIVTPTEDTRSVAFEMPVETGTYDCLMWADYIDAGTAAQTAEGGGNRYSDKYYDTSDLHNVTVKNMNALVDNNACDAFFYTCEVNKGNDACLLDVEMVRPFTRVSVLEKNLREYKLLLGLNATFTSYTTFNVATGTVGDATEVVNVNYPDFDPSKSENGTLFSTYIFSNAESRKWGNVQLTFTTDYNGEQIVTVPEIVPLMRGSHVKVSGNMMAESPEPDTEFDITFDIDVEDWVSDVVDVEISGIPAKVGDYYFADGTWSSVLTDANKDNCIGIIFALGAHEKDNLANYGPDAADKEIMAYVMALKSIPASSKDELISLFPAPNTQYLLSNWRPYFYKQKEGGGKDDAVAVIGKQSEFTWDIFNGVAATKALLEDATYAGAADKKDYPVLFVFENWKASAPCPANTSGWYIPSSGQLYEVAMKCYAGTYTLTTDDKDTYHAWDVPKDEAVLNALNAAIDAGVGTTFCGNNNANGYYVWTSTMNVDGMPMNIQIGAEKVTSLKAKPNYKDQGLVRPFLTVFK